MPRNFLGRVVRRAFVGVPSELYRWLRCLKQLRGTDLLVVPGTGVLTDAYGARAWPYLLFKWCLAARLCGCRVAFTSIGAGPLEGRLGRYLVRAALSLADVRTYRDAESRQYLEDIGVRTKDDPVYPDLVFSLGEAPVEPRRHRRPVVGLGVIGERAIYGAPISPEQYRAYVDCLVDFGEWAIRHGYDVRLLIGDWADDRQAKDEVHRLLLDRLPPEAGLRAVNETPCSVEELLSQIGGTDVVVGTRFHTALTGLLCGKPVVSISFHPKCDALMRAMGLSEYCLEIRELSAEQLVARFQEVVTNADALSAAIRAQTRAFRDALDEQYDLLFGQVLAPSRPRVERRRRRRPRRNALATRSTDPQPDVPSLVSILEARAGSSAGRAGDF